MSCPRGMCRASQCLMKSATEVLFRKSNNCSRRFLYAQLGDRHPASVVGYVELNPMRTSLVCEGDSYHWVMTDGAEYTVNGEGAGSGSSSSAAVDRQVQRLWASWTVSLPPHSPGCDNPWALGPTGLFVGRRRGLGQGSLLEPDDLIEAVRRESSTEGKRHRYSLTGPVLRTHLLWADGGLRQMIPPGSRVLVAACRTKTASV
jgi:hypothetical protein